MHLPHNEYTLGHAAKQAGMVSGHFGKWHLGHFNESEPLPHNGSTHQHFTLTTPAHVGFTEYYSALPMFEVSTTFNCGCFDPENKKGQCVEGHWSKPGGCDYFHSGTSTAPEEVVIDTTPMVKDGYGADNAKLLVDHFEEFATGAVANGTDFLAIVWFQNVHVQYTAVEEFTSKYPVSKNTTQQQQDYWGSLSALDAQVGRVRQILQKLKIAEDTVSVHRRCS
jgi:arylsulfatase A-like enzyme